MKKVLIVLAVLILIIIAALFIAAANANKLVASYKPAIEKQASQALGTDVKLGDISVSIFPSTTLEVNAVSLGKGQQQGFSVKKVMLDARLLPLLSRKLEIVSLAVISPNITIDKTKQGISIAGLPSNRTEHPVAEKKSGKSEAASGGTPLAINLEQFEIRDGTLVYIDHEHDKRFTADALTMTAGLQLEGSLLKIPDLKLHTRLLNKAELNVTSQDITFDQASGAAEIPAASISLLGSVIKIAANIQTKSSSGDFQLSSNGIALESLTPLLAELSPAVQPLQLKGGILPNLKGTFGPNGSYRAAGTVSLQAIEAHPNGMNVTDLHGVLNVAAATAEQKVSSDDLELKFQGAPVHIATKAKYSGTTAQIEEFIVKAFGGTVNAKVQLETSGAQPFESSFDASAIDLGQVVSTFKPDLAGQLTGTLAKVNGTLAGHLGNELMQSLEGSVAVAAKDTILKGVNVAAEVIKQLATLPFVGPRITEALKEGERQGLNENATVIRQLDGDFKIHDGRISTDNLHIVSDIFQLQGSGSVGFDLSTDLNATIIFSQAFSASLVHAAKDVSKVLDANGQLVVPLTLKGTLPKVAVLPNLAKLSETAAGKVIKDKASDLLEKALKGKKGKGLNKLLGF